MMKFKNFMSEKEIDTRWGDYKSEVNFSLYDHLSDPVMYLKEKMEQYPTHLSYDVCFLEKPYFNTITYTNFSDFLFIKPLQPDLANIQTTEALIYGSDNFETDFFDIYSNKLKQENMNKYKTKDIKNPSFKAVVCLVGQNRNVDMCYNKLKYIYEEHGKLAVYKPHPLTEPDFINSYYNNINKRIIISSKQDNVYDYIKNADIVYTTHWSETAFHSLCLGKQISPIDTFQSRFFGSFSPINSHLFETDKPKYTINKLFNDYRSGLINPKYQKDWKEKIDLYLDYIHEKRLEWRFKYV